MSGSGTGSGGGGVISPFAPVAGALSVLTTAGDLLYENATPANARLAAGSVNQVLGLAGSPLLPAWQLGLVQQATTGTTGYTLVNGTGTIISWTTPNDGALHRFMIFGGEHITVNETGGQITVGYTLPDGTSVTHTLFAAGATLGDLPPAFNAAITVQANTAVTVRQNSALTGGAAILWAEIWGS